MDREQKEITTESGKKAVIKTYLTGKENNELKAVLFEGVTMGADKDMSRMPLVNAFKREQKIIELSVISFDGSSDNIVDAIEALPSEQYDAFIKQLETELKLNLAKAK